METVKKPWGDFKQFTLNEYSTVKILTVNPGEYLSLQKHEMRNELWYFLTDGYVQIGEEKRKVERGNVVEIEKGEVHRLFSLEGLVEVLEVSFGKFDEDDIVRLEDKYLRT